MDKAAENKVRRMNKAKFDTHVNLLQIRDGLSKNDALVAAYIQGPGGLEKHLQPMNPAAKAPETK